MTKILLLSHGSLARELFNTTKLIVGEIDNVDYLDFDDNINSYADKIKEKICVGEEVLVLTDLFGGSPLMKVAECYNKCSDKNNIEIVTGMNLPMILETVTNLHLSLRELKELALNSGKSGIVDFLEKIEGS